MAILAADAWNAAVILCPLHENGCRQEEPTVGELAAHLATMHGMAFRPAAAAARWAEQRTLVPTTIQDDRPFPEPPEVVVPVISKPAALINPPPEEVAMAERSCKACGKPFLPKHGPQKYCPPCSKVKCNLCNLRGGLHHPDCMNRSGAKPVRLAGRLRHANPSAPNKSATRRAKIGDLLAAERARVSELREALRKAETRVEVLMELTKT